ncbi:hypothetical protein MMPV_005314 [Pyropia vietnamensis]
MPPPVVARIPLAPPPADLSLEAFVYDPPPRPLPLYAADPARPPPFLPPPLAPLGVVLLHPHPRLGGDAANPVVSGLAAALARHAGAVAVAVNGRGVGQSGGSAPLVRVTATAAADALAAVWWLRARLAGVPTGGSGGSSGSGGNGAGSVCDGGGGSLLDGGSPAPPPVPSPMVVLLGYSYGAAVAMRVAAAVSPTDPPLPVVVVSPPVGLATSWLLGVATPRRLSAGALFVGGDSDVFASAPDFRRVAAAAARGAGDGAASYGGGTGSSGGDGGDDGGGGRGGAGKEGLGGGGVELRLVPRAGHFWETAGAFATLRDTVVEWVIRQHRTGGARG